MMETDSHLDDKSVKYYAKRIREESDSERIKNLAFEIMTLSQNNPQEIALDMVKRAEEKVIGLVYFDEYFDEPRELSTEFAEELVDEIYGIGEARNPDARVKIHRSGSDNHEPIGAYGDYKIGVTVE